MSSLALLSLTWLSPGWGAEPSEDDANLSQQVATAHVIDAIMQAPPPRSRAVQEMMVDPKLPTALTPRLGQAAAALSALEQVGRADDQTVRVFLNAALSDDPAVRNAAVEAARSGVPLDEGTPTGPSAERREQLADMYLEIGPFGRADFGVRQGGERVLDAPTFAATVGDVRTVEELRRTRRTTTMLQVGSFGTAALLFAAPWVLNAIDGPNNLVISSDGDNFEDWLEESNRRSERAMILRLSAVGITVPGLVAHHTWARKKNNLPRTYSKAEAESWADRYNARVSGDEL